MWVINWPLAVSPFHMFTHRHTHTHTHTHTITVIKIIIIIIVVLNSVSCDKMSQFIRYFEVFFFLNLDSVCVSIYCSLLLCVLYI